eukprot:SAG31_NODE_365_length_16833_cov_98.502032_4_plen_74_part_00
MLLLAFILRLSTLISFLSISDADGGGDMYDNGNYIQTSLCSGENNRLRPWTDDMLVRHCVSADYDFITWAMTA